jgi:hypothetical protein
VQEVIHVVLIGLKVSFVDGGLIQSHIILRIVAVDLVDHSVPILNFSATKTLIYVTLSNYGSKRRGALFDALRDSSSDLECRSLNLVDERVFAEDIESFTAEFCHLSSQRRLQVGDVGSGEFCRAQRTVSMAYRFRMGREHMQTQQSYRCEQAGCSHTGIPHLNECVSKSEKTGKIEGKVK